MTTYTVMTTKFLPGNTGHNAADCFDVFRTTKNKFTSSVVMSLGPFLRTPFTDLTGCLINHQTYEKCGKMEMEMMDCLEAYGVERGQKMCADIIADFSECVGVRKQLLRFHAMRAERLKQYYFGDRKKQELFADPPRVDAF
ncbi:PREDICTED: uncharacterized protein LOC108360413 isoform X1 [Rhagoletis zephyria]|uniref:uncharacterized protein LOC108360413 isoform X1 n=2 Tax=Rhagoletis zephyria TaxID=28612 RepID=UPI00081130AB|nr:PREDICTED: uncharacterized protein LOC108360413 isoform X1 [Rhagoletis zephyria]XP_036327758.1 uncharacterized protein LOC118740369 isoform X1 [Rhagoletis pomonella]